MNGTSMLTTDSTSGAINDDRAERNPAFSKAYVISERNA